jgi:hypothetical protein
MKIAGCIFQERNIRENSSTTFEATYKKRRFYISSDHGFGQPKEHWLTRYNIDVFDVESGMYDVQTYEDCHSIRDAIIVALKGAMFLPTN